MFRLSTLAAAAALLLGAGASLSTEGYQRTKWGMSPAQVKALYAKSLDAEQARKLKPGAFDHSADFVLAETTILGRKAWATFTFGPHGLDDVVVRPDREVASHCPILRDALTQKYGDPKEKAEQDTPDLYLASYAWELAGTRIEFDCSSIRTKAGLARMRKKEPEAVFPEDLPADAERLHYLARTPQKSAPHSARAR